jgi:hypothetical protein
MALNNPQRQSVSWRNEAIGLARSNPSHAMDLARRIPDGWYRAQALAEIASGAPDQIADVAFAEAIAAAKSGPDAYQQVAVLGWVLAAALKRNEEKRAKQVAAIALPEIHRIEPPPSRAYALELLIQAAWRLPMLRAAFIAATLKHLPPERCHYFWRARRLYRAIALLLGKDDPRKAAGFVAALPAGKMRDQIEALLASKGAERQRLAALAQGSAFRA